MLSMRFLPLLLQYLFVTSISGQSTSGPATSASPPTPSLPALPALPSLPALPTLPSSASTQTDSPSPSSSSSSDNSGSSGSSDDSDCSQILCSPGNLQWVFPDITVMGSPFTLGKKVTLKWSYNSAVKIFPANLTIQVKKPDNKYIDLATDIPGGPDNMQYDWVPKNLATGYGYRVVIFDTSVGLRGTPTSGGAKGATSLQFGINSDNSNGGEVYHSMASQIKPLLLFRIAIIVTVLAGNVLSLHF